MKLWWTHATCCLQRMLDWQGLLMLQLLLIVTVMATPLLLLPSLTGGWGDHVLFGTIVLFVSLMCGATGFADQGAMRRMPVTRFAAVTVDLVVWGIVVGAVVIGGATIGIMLALLVLDVVHAFTAMQGLLTAMVAGFSFRRFEVDTSIPVALPISAFAAAVLTFGAGYATFGVAVLLLMLTLLLPDGLALPSLQREIVAPELRTRTYRGAELAFLGDLARGVLSVFALHMVVLLPALVFNVGSMQVRASLLTLAALNAALFGTSAFRGGAVLPLPGSRIVSHMQLFGAVLGGGLAMMWALSSWLGGATAEVLFTGMLASFVAPVGMISIGAARASQRWTSTRVLAMTAGACLLYAFLVFAPSDHAGLLGLTATAAAVMALLPWMPAERQLAR